MIRRLPAALAACVTAAGAVAVPAGWATTQGRSFFLYAKPTRAQFINHADDRARGLKSNPFNADIVLPPPPRANTGKKGGRAGDNALFAFKLYSGPNLKRLVGTATYSCTFNFAHEAICEADFEFAHGSMVAMGPAQLGSSFTKIVLPVTGGTGRYVGAHGQMTSTPSIFKNTQIVHFQLV
jgi:hypothetical protein